MDLTLRSYERAFGFTFSPEDRVVITQLLDKRSRHVLRKLERMNRPYLKKREIVRIFQESEVECFDVSRNVSKPPARNSTQFQMRLLRCARNEGYFRKY